MKDQVEQLQSIGIRALAIEVDEEEAGEMDRLDYLWKSWKPAVEGVPGGKNSNKHIVAIAIDEDDEVHSVTEWKAFYSSIW